MTTPLGIGNGNKHSISSDANVENNDENAHPTSPKLASSDLSAGPRSLLSSNNQAMRTTKSQAFDTPIMSNNSSNNFSIDHIVSTEDVFSIDNLATSDYSLTFELSETERLERMMTKFDNIQKGSKSQDSDKSARSSILRVDTEESDSFHRGQLPPDTTPKVLNGMIAKFDVLQSSSIDEPDQARMMRAFDRFQASEIRDDNTYDDDINTEQGDSVTIDPSAHSARLFQILPVSSGCEDTGIEVQKSENLIASYSNSSYEMYADIEQFRSADSHCDHDQTMVSHRTIPRSDSAAGGAVSPSEKFFEERIAQLVGRVADLESKNSELESKLITQHDQDVQDMYQNPYSDPFATTSPTKPKGGSFHSSSNPFLESATGNLNADMIVPVASTGNMTMNSAAADNSDLHRELTELRMQNQSLQNDLRSSETAKNSLSVTLKTLESEEKQKSEQVTLLTKELSQSKERESSLRQELDACKVRLEGFEIAQRQHQDAIKGDENADSSSHSFRSRSGRSESRKSFFSGGEKSSMVPSCAAPGDVATALVVSQRQNEALQAHNEELESANANLQKKCHELMAKYGLKEPAAGDDKGKQLYSRYLEMKSSLSSLSVVLEDVQEKNSKLNERVAELETELSEQDQEKQIAGHSSNDEADDGAQSRTLQTTISAEKEEALKDLVEKLEVQILDYREAEQRHGIVKAELESAVQKLEDEATTLREQLESSKSLLDISDASVSTLPVYREQEAKLRQELEKRYQELESRIAGEKGNELQTELESLRKAMNAAAAESTNLLNQMEKMLTSSQDELRQERAKFEELEAKYTALQSNDQRSAAAIEEAKEALSNSERLLEENGRLNAAIVSLQEQTQQLKIELDKKTIKIEKSEQRLSSKHEKSQQLKEVNASLREGIQQLKGHLAKINEEAGKTENSLAVVQSELDSEREKVEKLQVSNGSLQTELEVLKASMKGRSDEASATVEKLEVSNFSLQTELDVLKASMKERSDKASATVEKLKDSNGSLQTELEVLKASMKGRSDEASATVEKLKVSNGSLQTELEVLKASMKERSEEATATVERLKVSNGTLHNELEVLKASMKERSEEASATVERLKVSNGSLQTELEVLKASMDERSNDASATVERLKVSNGSLQTELEVLKASMKECNDEASAAQRELVEKMLGEKRELETRNSTMQQDSNRLKLAIITATKRMEGSTQTIDDLTRSNGSLKGELESVKSKAAKAATESARQFSELEKLLSTTQEELNEEERVVESLEGQVDSLTMQVDELKKCKGELQISLEDVRQELSAANGKRLEFETLLEVKKTDLTVQIQNLNTEKASALVKEAELNAKLSKKDDKIEELTGKLRVTTMEKDMLRSVSIATDEFRKRSENLARELLHKRKELQELNTKLQIVSSSQDEYRETVRKISDEKDEITKKSNIQGSELKKKTKEIEELTDDLQELECSQAHHVEQLDKKTKELEELTDELQKLECAQAHNVEELESKNEEIEELKAEVQRLERFKTIIESQNSESVAKEKAAVISTMIALHKEEKQSLIASLKDKEENIGKTKALAKLLGEENSELRSRIATFNVEKECLEKALEKNKGDLAAVSAEKKTTADDKASTDVRLWEVEMLLGSTKRELADALERNDKLTGKVNNLESSIEKCQLTNAQTLHESETHACINNENARKIAAMEKDIAALKGEKEELLKRTAALARRDQLQKASLSTSNEEITKLISTIADFQGRFESLAEQVENGQEEKLKQLKEFEEEEAKWRAEKDSLHERIKALISECDEIEATKNAIESELAMTIGRKDSSMSLNTLQPCPTDRSIFNNKVSELDQELQLLQVTLDSTKQERDEANAELDETKNKLSTCEKELTTCRNELQALVTKSESALQSINEKVTELEGDLESMRLNVERTSDERDSALTENRQTKAKLEKQEQTQQELQSRYDSCFKELESCKSELTTAKNDEAQRIKDLTREKTRLEKQLTAAATAMSTNQHADDNKKALTFITDELNEAHVREQMLEEMLASCKKELFVCQKKIKSLSPNGANLAQENGTLRAENTRYLEEKENLDRQLRQCTKERDSLKALSTILQKDVDELKEEMKNTRVVTGANQVSSSKDAKGDGVQNENTMLKELLATSQRSVAEAKTMQQQLAKQIEAASKRETRLTTEILSLKARNEEMEQQLNEQEKELDEFENDFALARNDARKVVEELRSQLLELEKRNQQLEADGTVGKTEDLKNKLRQLIQQNKRMQKEIEYGKVRERRLESQLGLETRRTKK
eukprot:CAMPEP_0172411674 /NCGR_PEP_ID=MMETSP1061-20121228/77500_1 /TAXON_ID=37318 /ORGANISM="Pseudo-nitzschia pungens, Strain cf. pungens" /LENGTH=2278 /DNA_ID=CAMNT_0013147887 /DNA_START=464 /DNA_END=7300 /DNA_ORIENTATION=-